MATFDIENNVFIKALTLNSQSSVLALSTAGKFVNRNISVQITAKSGSASTPATTIAQAPTITLTTATGSIVAEYNKSQSITPTVAAGWINAGTAGTISTTGSTSLTLPASTATVTDNSITIQPGWFGATTALTVTSGSASTPATTIAKAPTISVTTATGVVTARYNSSQSITPTVVAGWVSSGTAGTVSTTGNATLTLPTAGVSVSGNTFSLTPGWIKSTTSLSVTTVSVTANNASVSGSNFYQAFLSVPTGYVSATTAARASFANSGSSGTSYLDISNTTGAPILVSGDFLYINKGYTDNVKISLAKLVPNEASVLLADSHILTGYAAYNNNGILVAGSIPIKSNTDITENLGILTVPSGYYGTTANIALDAGDYSAGVTLSAVTVTPSISISSGTGSSGNINTENVAGITVRSTRGSTDAIIPFDVINTNIKTTSKAIKLNGILSISQNGNPASSADYQIIFNNTIISNSHITGTVPINNYTVNNLKLGAGISTVSYRKQGSPFNYCELVGSIDDDAYFTPYLYFSPDFTLQWSTDVSAFDTLTDQYNFSTTAPSSGDYLIISPDADHPSYSATGSAYIIEAGYINTGNKYNTATATVGVAEGDNYYIPIVTPTFNGGALTVNTNSNTLSTTPVVTLSATGTLLTTGTATYGVTSTKPSGTDGTNYLSIDGNGIVSTTGLAISSVKMTSSTVTYSNTAGVIASHANVVAYAGINTTTGTSINITPTITDNFATHYMPIVSTTFSGGGLTVSSTNAISTNMATTSTSSYYIDAVATITATRAQLNYNNAAGAIAAHNGATAVAVGRSNTSASATRIYIPQATFSTTYTLPNYQAPEFTVVNNDTIIITTSNAFNNNLLLQASTSPTTSTLSFKVKTETAGYMDSDLYASNLGGQGWGPLTRTTYLQGVTLNKPASGEAKFSITVPNGEGNDMITFVFHVDPSGNVVVDDSTANAFS